MSTEGSAIRILVIEDEAPIRHLLRAYFQDTQFKLMEAETAKEGMIAIAEKRPDLVLLDLGLPDQDGLEVITSIRLWSSVPVIVISARGQEEEKVKCLEAGADDYLTKPFGMAELTVRIKVALRHVASQSSSEPIFETDTLKIDFNLRRVWSRGQEVHLPPLQYNLLTTLVKHAGKVVTNRQLLSEVWGPEYSEESQYLRVYVGYLRKKLEETPEDPKLILTEHRVGYRLSI